jgi:dTDP-glucose 4,6-dehydratase
MRVLVTGAGGFIGAHVVEHLLENTDWEVVGLDSFRHKGDSLRATHERLLEPRYTVFCHDLRAPISARLADQIGPVDFILNLASESHVDRSIQDPVPFVENNVSLVLNVLEYARRAKPRVFVQISTDEVYGPTNSPHGHIEWSPIMPSNPYAASKAAQEAIAIAYWRTYGVPVVITNTMNNFGERQDPEKFIPLLIEHIARGETVQIHGTPGQIGSRFYLHARNHADALLFLLRRYQEGVPAFFSADAAMPPRFNVVGEVEIDNLALAELVAGLMGRELHYQLVDFHSTRPGHDPRYALDGSRLALLGWQAPVPFEQSLERTIDWTLAHREWLLPV